MVRVFHLTGQHDIAERPPYPCHLCAKLYPTHQLIMMLMLMGRLMLSILLLIHVARACSPHMSARGRACSKLLRATSCGCTVYHSLHCQCCPHVRTRTHMCTHASTHGSASATGVSRSTMPGTHGAQCVHMHAQHHGRCHRGGE